MKLFISQPMRGKTDEEIQTERERIVSQAKACFGEDLEVIDSFFAGSGNPNPLVCLAESFKLLGEADIVWFACGWHFARGCVMEHLAVEKYLPDVAIVEGHHEGYCIVRNNERNGK